MNTYRLQMYEIEKTIELPLLYINRIGQLMGGSLSSTDVCFEIYSNEIILGRIYVFTFFLFDEIFQ
jgi:hypothetical protein